MQGVGEDELGVLAAGLEMVDVRWGLFDLFWSWMDTYFDRAAAPFGRPFAALEADPVALAPGAFADAEDWVELAGYAEVEVESWSWEVVGWRDPVLGWSGFGVSGHL